MIVWYLGYATDFSHDVCVINTKEVGGIQTFCIKLMPEFATWMILVFWYAEVLLIRLKVKCIGDFGFNGFTIRMGASWCEIANYIRCEGLY